jgi:hypothetical protein
VRAALVLAVGALVLPAVALAKGASDARIVGPGFEKTLRGDALAHLAEYGGVYHAIFGGTHSPMVETRPAGELGPRYRSPGRSPARTTSSRSFGRSCTRMQSRTR